MDKKIKQDLQGMWDFFADVILEYFLLALFIFLVFTRIQSIMAFTAEYPEYSFWKLLDLDMNIHTGIYVGFVIVFCLLIIAKGQKYQKDKKNQKRLDNMMVKLDEIAKSIAEMKKKRR